MRTIPLLAALAVSLAACGGSDSPTSPTPNPSTASVAAAGDANTFTPATATIAPGGTVTWTFAQRPHNVTFDAAAGAPANVPTTTNGSESRTFASAGTFVYHCTVHSGMTGTVVVR